MTVNNVDDVVALDQRAFGESGWSRRHFVGELTESPVSVFYALTDRPTDHNRTDQDARLLGYFGVWHIVEQLQLCTFAVDPAHHGSGLGGLMLGCVVRLSQRLACEVIQLEVRKSNTVARRLYRSRGFIEDAVRRNLYSNPREDGILMSIATPASCAYKTRMSERTARRWPGGLRLDWDDRGGHVSEWWPASERPSRGAAIH